MRQGTRLKPVSVHNAGTARIVEGTHLYTNSGWSEVTGPLLTGHHSCTNGHATLMLCRKVGYNEGFDVMKKTKFIHGLLVLGLVLGCLAGVMTAVRAIPSTPVAAATAEDNTSARTITLHKYTESATPSTDKLTGTTADASKVPSDSKPLQGIKFAVTKVEKVSGKTLSAADSSTYTVDTSFTAMAVTSDADGKAVANVGIGKAADGYYLVVEKASKLVATAAAPFIIHLPQTTKNASTGDMTLLYDVNVYPKNKVDDDAVALNPEKFVQDAQAAGAADGEAPEVSATSTMQGGMIVWDLVVTRPADIQTTDDSGKTTYASKLILSDPLITKNLTYGGYSYIYMLAPDGTKTKLETTDYDDSEAPVGKLKVDGDYSVAAFALTDAGIKKFAAQPEGTKLVIPVATTITADTTGKIVNTFDTYYKGTATTQVIHEHSGTSKPLTDGATDEMKPTKPTSADTSAPVVYTGNVDIQKTDEDGNHLANATFTLYKTEADAKAGSNPVKDGNGRVMTAVSGSDGVAQFVGLYVDPTTQQQDYYAVESDAPVGYDLNGGVFKVTAKRDTSVDATVKDHDNAFPNLPLTGKNGQLLLYGLAGLLIIIGGAGVVIAKRRHAA